MRFKVVLMFLSIQRHEVDKFVIPGVLLLVNEVEKNSSDPWIYLHFTINFFPFYFLVSTYNTAKTPNTVNFDISSYIISMGLYTLAIHSTPFIKFINQKAFLQNH